MDALQEVIYLILDVSDRVDVFYDQNLEGFLAAVSDDSKNKAVIWMKELLVKKRSSVQNSKVDTFLDISNDF